MSPWGGGEGSGMHVLPGDDGAMNQNDQVDNIAELAGILAVLGKELCLVNLFVRLKFGHSFANWSLISGQTVGWTSRLLLI